MISDTESVGDVVMDSKVTAAATQGKESEEKKVEEKKGESSEEELAKAEAFKEKGNEFFKSK